MKTIALVGNPNVGKTTLFNVLTNSKCHIGNWPGVTVKKRWGYISDKYTREKIKLVDLPGIYSLSAVTPEEIVTHTYLIKHKPDKIINIVDASNLERNLYLTVELIEMGFDVVIALNMVDIAKKRGIIVDVKKLSKLLGVKVIPIIARTSKNIDVLVNALKEKQTINFKLNYGKQIESLISSIKSKLTKNCKNLKFERWMAIYYLLGDKPIFDVLGCLDISIHTNKNLILSIYKIRNMFVKSILKKVTNTIKTNKHEYILDSLFLNKYLSIPSFFVIILSVYLLTFSLSSPINNLILTVLNMISNYFNGSDIFSVLFRDAVIQGIGNIFTFIPMIFILFFLFAILQDFGYMARVAFVWDSIMSKFGLNGKSFISFLLGLGCNVPAIMSTRNISNKNERLTTILVNPLIPCSARILIFSFITSLFFDPFLSSLIVVSLIFMGLFLAIFSAWLFNKFLFKSKFKGLLIELPPYQIPSLKNAFSYALTNTYEFISKAGTFIFLFTLILWFLNEFPSNNESYLIIFGKFISFLFKPLGFDWRLSVALISGIFAKEIVISSLNILYGTGLHLLGFKTLLSFLVFSAIYSPCLATIVVIKNETNSWKWALFSIIYSFVLAYLITLGVKLIF